MRRWWRASIEPPSSVPVSLRPREDAELQHCWERDAVNVDSDTHQRFCCHHLSANPIWGNVCSSNVLVPVDRIAKPEICREEIGSVPWSGGVPSVMLGVSGLELGL